MLGLRKISKLKTYPLMLRATIMQHSFFGASGHMIKSSTQRTVEDAASQAGRWDGSVGVVGINIASSGAIIVK